MGYYASGGGSLRLKQHLPEKIMEIVSDEFEECYENEESLILDLGFTEDKYYEDSMCHAMESLAPYVKSGSVEFGGEDNSVWRFKFSNGTYEEENASIVYPSDVKAKNEKLVEDLLDMTETALFPGGKPPDQPFGSYAAILRAGFRYILIHRKE